MRSTLHDLDGPVHVADAGGQGPPILLVHGIGSSHANFGAVAEPLAQHGHVLAVDLLGYGYTPLAGRESDLRSNRRMLVRLLHEVVPEPAVLVGTSLGGLLSMLVADAAPERVRGMVLVGPGQPHPRGIPMNWSNAGLFLALTVPGLGRLAARWTYRGDAERLARVALARTCHDPTRVPPALRAGMLEMTRERMAMPWTPTAFRQTARSMVRELSRTAGFDDFLLRLRPPTLLVQGTEDRLVAADASRGLAARRPDWAVHMLEGVGHSPQLEVPEQFVDLVGGWVDHLEASTS